MTHVTDGVTDDIVWLQGKSMPLFKTGWVLKKEKKKKRKQLIYVLYILYVIYFVNILYAYFIYIYIAYICRVKSVWYINRTSFTTYIG